MELRYGLTGADRKALVKAVADIIGAESRYLGVPSCAYAVGEHYTITRDGTLEIADGVDAEQIKNIASRLSELGFKCETEDISEIAASDAQGGEAESESSDNTSSGGVKYTCSENEDELSELGYSIGFPLSDLSDEPFTEDILQRLRAIVASKHRLFQKALGTSRELEITLEEDCIYFDWFDRNFSVEQMEMYTAFFRALYKMAEKSKRITAKEKEIENEKFTMRTFLNRIGLSGEKYKPLRKELMKNLSGNSAFRYGKPPEDTK